MKAFAGECARFECFPPGHIYSSKTGKFEKWFLPNWVTSTTIPKTPYDPKTLREAFEKAKTLK